MDVVKECTSLLMSGAPLEPPGSFTTHALHLAITTNCTPLLPLLLAGGASLTATSSSLGPVKLAWFSTEITPWVGVLVTKVSDASFVASDYSFVCYSLFRNGKQMSILH